MMTCAAPEASVATVSEAAVGLAGLLVRMLKGPDTTSKRTWRPAPGAPPGPCTTIDAVPVWPEQIALAPHSLRFGATAKVLSSVTALTVTATGAVWPT